MVTTKDIQKRLVELGYDPGPVDGIRGRLTIRAIIQFQHDKGLAEDGVAGPVTRSKLFAGTDNPQPGFGPDLPWYEEARRLMGTKEVQGRGSNKDILDWAVDLETKYASDDIPWCGLFAAHCVGATLPDEQLPGGFLLARNWRRFGRPCEPTKGAILIFWRGSKTEGVMGHVGFYAGEDDKGFYVLGGNQNDMVCIARLPKDRLLDVRFPTTAPSGERTIVRLTPSSDPYLVDEA